jgi:hypothetical protein
MEGPGTMTTHTCTCCGKPTNDPTSARFGLPDALLAMPESLRREIGDTWNDDTLPSPVDGRAYIRALLHIPLIGKHPEMLWCVWVEASEKDVKHAMDVWDTRDYADVSMHGYLANTIPGYGCLGAQVHIGVRDISQLPHIEAARHKVLNRILTEPQPYEAAVPA